MGLLTTISLDGPRGRILVTRTRSRSQCFPRGADERKSAGIVSAFLSLSINVARLDGLAQVRFLQSGIAKDTIL
jgi:hypothetical protein